MSNAFDKLSVLDSFIEEVNSYLPEIETNLERLAQSPGDMDALEETHRRTHTIGGSASMMDFPGLAHVAYGMEDILGDALGGITTLDEPVLGLLQRSLGRLHQLLEGIRNGVDEEAVIAEDDADYSQYRALIEAPEQPAQPTQPVPPVQVPEYSAPSAQSLPVADLPPLAGDEIVEDDTLVMPTPLASSMPSFDEVLASFRTPSIETNDEVAWPEETASDEFSSPSYADENSSSQLSALDALVASTRQEPAVHPPQETPPRWIEDELPSADDATAPERNLPVPAQGADLVTQMASFSQLYSNVQHEAQNVEMQATALKNLVAQLRSALSIIDSQRGEFKSFLDGSKDALDRMEDWAGRAMGLNLRNSPEQVRRYLPLSVMWVANSKLKKVLDQLNQTTGDAELADERMEYELQQLRVLLSSGNDRLQTVQEQAQHLPESAPVWTPWEMQREQDALRERVTFERYGNPEAMRAEIEAQVREELRQEYEVQTNAQASRAEMEQQIRNEVRQEYEELHRLQARARAGEETPEVLQELEERLRGEIEIQVRQDFLKQLTSAEDEANRRSQAARDATPSSVSNYVERASEATERFASSSASTLIPVPASSSAAPSSTSKSAPSFAADLGEEATEIFRAEAEEHLQTISMHVAALEKSPQNLELIQAVRRATHTLKGAAGMMGFRSIADLSHIFEDLLDSIMEGTTTISPTVLSLILDTAETLDTLITGRDANAMTDDARVNALRVRYTDLLGEHTTPPPADGHADAYIDAETDSGDDAISGQGSMVGVVADGQAEATPRSGSHGDLSVRVRLQKLDELVNLFGELLVNRSVLEERIQRLVRLVSDAGVSSNRLRDVGQKLESRFEAATLPSGRSVQAMIGEGDQSLALYNISKRNGNGHDIETSHFEEFDELELDRYNEFHLLARGLSEGISDMTTLSAEMDTIIRECEGIFARENRLNTTFQDRLMKVRLVPLSSMTPRLYRAARAVALKQGKDFEFLLEGEETEVDRTVFEEIAGPLLHLIRNAVNHAIETPDVRMQQGKQPVGTIKLSAAYEGNQVVITVSDDGTGIDPEHVRNTAIQRGLIRPDQHLSETDVLNLIFLSGFSTAEVLSEESGRGVGLDVVRDSVSRLRGTLVVETTPGHGTSFVMKFPTSLAIQSAMLVRVSGQQFAIPTVMVESIGRLDSFKRTTVAGQSAVLVRGDAYPLSMLAQYLSLPYGQVDEHSQMLLINAGGSRVALLVDEIKSKQDIVTKNLGPHLRHVHGIAGGTVLGNGRVVLILELTELLSQRQRVELANTGTIPVRREVSAPTSVRQSIDVSTSQLMPTPTRSQTPAAVVPERGKHVLVVDDSPSVRRVVGNMLKQNQWEVQVARDGVEALEMISYETPAAVLLDIEMPRMDGYELIATIRSQEQYRTLPLIVLTSRAAAKHQQRAVQLGANDYVVKPYQDEELLSKLQSLVYGAPVR